MSVLLNFAFSGHGVTSLRFDGHVKAAPSDLTISERRFRFQIAARSTERVTEL
jgi:hypothetical protein